MKLLDEIVYNINCIINPNSNSFVGGIVRVVSKEGIDHNYIGDDHISFDDKYSNYLYHKITGESFEVLQNRGNKTTYNRTARLNIVVMTESRGFDDYLVSKLSKIKHLNILSIDWDSVGIYRREVGNLNSYDPKKYVFTISYEVVYKSECDEC